MKKPRYSLFSGDELLVRGSPGRKTDRDVNFLFPLNAPLVGFAGSFVVAK
jgi:hypothetical protein